MVVRQNVLSTIILKNVKLSYKNVKLHLATPEICQARNLSSNNSVAFLIALGVQCDFLTLLWPSLHNNSKYIRKLKIKLPNIKAGMKKLKYCTLFA